MDNKLRARLDLNGFRVKPDFEYRHEDEESYVAVYTNNENRKLGLIIEDYPYIIDYEEVVACKPIQKSRTAGFGPVSGAVVGYSAFGWIGAYIASQASNLHEKIEEYKIEFILKDYTIPIYLLYNEKVTHDKLNQVNQFCNNFNECINEIKENGERI